MGVLAEAREETAAGGGLHRCQCVEQFGEIVRLHQSAVYAAAYGITGDRALSEDIAQETFTAAWRSFSALRDVSRMREWLRGIARNLAHKAKRKVVPSEELSDVVAGDDPVCDAIAKDEERLTWAALRQLPETYREALLLYYWEDHSAGEVASSLGITEAAALQRLSRGRTLLREKVDRFIEGPLRRSRPGAVLTAAIMAAVAATAAGTVSAAAATGKGQLAIRGCGLSHRVQRRFTVTLLSIGTLGTLGAAMAVSQTRCQGGDANHRLLATAVLPSRLPDTSIQAATPSLSGAGTTLPDFGALAGEGLSPHDSLDSNGRFWAPSITSDNPANTSLSSATRFALSRCFVDTLVGHPVHLDADVRDGKIASVAVEPFDGATNRVIVRDAESFDTAIQRSDLSAWLVAMRQIGVSHDDTRQVGHEKAMSVGEFLEVCASASLRGTAISGSDAVHHLVLTWNLFTSKKIDNQAYSDLGVADGAVRGPTIARVTIVTFLDIVDAPGFGATTVSVLSQILTKYPNDVRVVVKLCPFEKYGHDLAAEAVYAAGEQRAFWPMLELVTSNREHIMLEDLVGYAKSLHLDTARFRRDLEQHVFHEVVNFDRDQMEAMDIHALPSSIVNGKRVHGALPASVYISAIDAILRETNISSDP